MRRVGSWAFILNDDMIRAMVRGFLWSGRDHETVSTKVAWSCLIKAKNQRGLGLVDLVHQSKSLLNKLLVQSLQLGPKLWKMLLRDRGDLWYPMNGGPWKAKMWWWFNPGLKLKKLASMEDMLARAIMRVWSSVREGLVLVQLKLWRNNSDNHCSGTPGLDAKTVLLA